MKSKSTLNSIPDKVYTFDEYLGMIIRFREHHKLAAPTVEETTSWGLEWKSWSKQGRYKEAESIRAHLMISGCKHSLNDSLTNNG